MDTQEARREFERARENLASDNALAALSHLEKALKVADNPEWHSYLGYCIARERGQYRKGIELCQSSIHADAANPVHYLNLAKLHILSGNKAEAIATLRDGMAQGGDQEIETMLMEVGSRKPPVVTFLDRDNPINRYLGFLLNRLGLR